MNRVFRHSIIVALGAFASAATADAYEFRVRFVQRVGPEDIELMGGNVFYASTGELNRIRVQFGVFDDAESAAPAGGLIGWNHGTITVNGHAGNSDDYRNSPDGVPNGVGRLPPFDFAPGSSGANGLPAEDPFEALTGIDNTQGPQTVAWVFGSPQPPARIRGRNTWVSTYEITVRGNAGATPYSIDLSGDLLAATSWDVFDLVPPEGPDQTGHVGYVPLLTTPHSFFATLQVTGLPSPSAAALLGGGGLLGVRRRR